MYCSLFSKGKQSPKYKDESLGARSMEEGFEHSLESKMCFEDMVTHSVLGVVVFLSLHAKYKMYM